MSVGRVDVGQQLVEGGVVVQRRRGVDAVGRVGNTEQDELGLAVGGDERCCRKLGVVAVPNADLVEACARARGRLGKARLHDQLVRLEHRLVRAEEEFAGGDRPLAARRADVDRCIERDRGRSQLGPGSRERERAADGASAARLQVADEPRRLAQERPGLDGVVVQQALLAHRGADVKLTVSLLEHVEASDAVHVDERCSASPFGTSSAARGSGRPRAPACRCLARAARQPPRSSPARGTRTAPASRLRHHDLPVGAVGLAFPGVGDSLQWKGVDIEGDLALPGVTDEAQIVLARARPGARRRPCSRRSRPSSRGSRLRPVTLRRLRTGRSGRVASRVLPPGARPSAVPPRPCRRRIVGRRRPPPP